MDFSNRGQQPVAIPGQPLNSGPAPVRHNKVKADKEIWYRVGVVAVVVAVVALLVGLSLFAYSNNSTTKDTESQYINGGKLQAVFLNTGQVYFGNIKTLNNNYLILNNIFYLQTTGSGSTATSSSNSNVTLVKLGCELHMPYDQMVINRTQVTFWENLQGNGQVAKAVATWEKQHPNGQQCADQSSSSSSTSGSTVQNAGTRAKP